MAVTVPNTINTVETKLLSGIASLKGLGIFRDYIATHDVPAFQKYNLIYGFNGSGKTTLSRIFASLEAGVLHPELPQDGMFELKLNDGTTINTTNRLDILKGSLLVFNVDFIEQNLRWKDGTANPVFYLGKAQADLVKKLEEKEGDLKALELKRTEADKERLHKEGAFTDHKRDAARLIAEQLGLGRSYIAPHLVADYDQGTYGETHQLSEDERKQQRAIITQDAPLPKRDLLNATPFALAKQVSDVRKILDTTLGTLTLEDIREHETMLKWIKEGVNYHDQHDLSSCLFCGNGLTEDRMQALKQAIDDKFDKLTQDIATTRENVQSLRNRLTALEKAVPSVNDISKELQSGFLTTVGDLKTSITTGIEIITTMLNLIEKKAETPNACVDTEQLLTDEDAANWDIAVIKHLSDINTVIEAHNKSHDGFQQVQNEARTKLKNHFLADSQADFSQKKTDFADADAALGIVKKEHDDLKKEIEQLKQEIRQHGPAADLLNKMIHNYLGHKELEIGILEDGYQIRRHGKPLTGSLSEGEKTAIALCYFLCSLEADGRKLKNLTVVLDDPISSLDSKALNYAFSLIKVALSQAGQLIILTHNLHFMNEMKKWLKNKTEHHLIKTETEQIAKEKATATLLFLDVVQNGGAETRSCAIKVMPTLIREYESEYHYLFHLALKFSESTDVSTGYFYIMPNALRKVLEIFLAFKLPGGSGLSNKVENIANGSNGLDPNRIRALDRLVQLESHADNLEDLVTFSSMTIEETKDSADALLEVIQKLDPEHYNRMCRLCR